MAVISELMAFMNHGHELILKADLVEKNAESTEEQDTQMKKPHETHHTTL